MPDGWKLSTGTHNAGRREYKYIVQSYQTRTHISSLENNYKYIVHLTKTLTHISLLENNYK